MDTNALEYELGAARASPRPEESGAKVRQTATPRSAREGLPGSRNVSKTLSRSHSRNRVGRPSTTQSKTDYPRSVGTRLVSRLGVSIRHDRRIEFLSA